MLIVFNVHLMAVFLLMVILLMTILLIDVLMVVFVLLHAFHMLFLHHIHIIHHGQNLHVAGVQGAQHLLHPLLHLAAVANQHIGLLHGDHICGRRFKGMAVHTRGHHQLKLHLIPRNLTHKIIVGKDGGHHEEAFILALLAEDRCVF